MRQAQTLIQLSAFLATINAAHGGHATPISAAHDAQALPAEAAFDIDAACAFDASDYTTEAFDEAAEALHIHCGMRQRLAHAE